MIRNKVERRKEKDTMTEITPTQRPHQFFVLKHAHTHLHAHTLVYARGKKKPITHRLNRVVTNQE